MTSSPELWKWSAVDLAAAIRDGEISSEEVVRAHLDRIGEINPAVNALTSIFTDDALDAARGADRKRMTGETLGAFHGVPFSVKDNIDLAGRPTSFGVVEMKDSRAERDAPIIAMMRTAGAIPMARSNMPDYGFRFHTDNDLFGPTRNPWSPDRTAGGSSGGEAAALATGMSPLGIGGDMGGSLRYPAQCCGIAALKPGLGRISRVATRLFSGPPGFYAQIADVSGPMARHVRDLRAALHALSQPDLEDPLWAPAARLRSDADRPLRIAFAPSPNGAPLAPAVTTGLEVAVAALRDAGCEIIDTDPPGLDRLTAIIEDIANTETLGYWDDMKSGMSAGGRRFGDLLMTDAKRDLSAYEAAIAARHGLIEDWSVFFRDVDIILGPVSTQSPFRIGDDVSDAAFVRRFIQSIVLTEACNLLGLPSVIAPVAIVDGAPQAAQFIGRRHHEDDCLFAAEMIEARCGVVTPIDPRAAA